MEPIIRTPRKTSLLLELIGAKPNKYKILLDESLSYLPKEERQNELVWCEMIQAYKGVIYLSCASPLELAFFTESIGKINNIEKELGDLVKVVRMDGEGLVLFKAKDFKKMAKLAGAKTNRKLSDAHKEKMLQALDEYRKDKK